MPSSWRVDGTLSDGSFDVQITGSNAKTVQTHNAVSVPATTGYSIQTIWMDCNGFGQLAFSLLNNASTNSFIDIFWSNDGITQHGTEQGVAVATLSTRVGQVSVKARYAKLVLGNTDAAAHTMSAWAYLKV